MVGYAEEEKAAHTHLVVNTSVHQIQQCYSALVTSKYLYTPRQQENDQSNGGRQGQMTDM